MAERSFTAEVAHLRKGAGDTFTGEGILAITKALLENGVGYVGGYQGAPVSHLMDVLADAQDLLAELGVRFESNANEAAAAAMLSASVNYHWDHFPAIALCILRLIGRNRGADVVFDEIAHPVAPILLPFGGFEIHGGAPVLISLRFL